jgi:NAD+ synthase
MEKVDLAIDPEATTEVLTGFLRKEMQSTGMKKLVVGLSGGLDSAVSTWLAAEAVGPENIQAVLMPYRTSSPESITHAKLVVDALGIGSETVDISAMVDGFEAVTGDTDRLRLGNVMARCRMVMLYDRSARDRAIVLGTSNKTEILLGYGTLFGDTACALNPIGELYKTQVFALARHLKVPAPILNKPPSADLWPDQEDEDELGFSYDEVDRLLAMLIDARHSPETALASGFSRDTIERVRNLVLGSRFKRRLPVIARLSTGEEYPNPRAWDS